jgi:hypothetical protein
MVAAASWQLMREVGKKVFLFLSFDRRLRPTLARVGSSGASLFAQEYLWCFLDWWELQETEDIIEESLSASDIDSSSWLGGTGVGL